MLPALMFAAALTSAFAEPPATDPLAEAAGHYQLVESYLVTLHSFHDDAEEHIRYYYRKPGFVRMEFIHPHQGAVLIYNPISRRVRLWPFGVGRFPELNLSPDNPLIRSSRGQHADRSDVGALFENIRALQAAGNTEMLGEENVDGHAALHLLVTGAADFSVAGVHRYELWLDKVKLFPVRVISRDQQDAIIESVMMQELKINAVLPETLFDPEAR